MQVCVVNSESLLAEQVASKHNFWVHKQASSYGENNFPGLWTDSKLSSSCNCMMLITDLPLPMAGRARDFMLFWSATARQLRTARSSLSKASASLCPGEFTWITHRAVKLWPGQMTASTQKKYWFKCTVSFALTYT